MSLLAKRASNRIATAVVENLTPAAPRTIARQSVIAAVSSQVKTGLKTVKQVIKDAKLDWTVSAHPLIHPVTKKPLTNDKGENTPFNVIVRDDSQAVLAVMGDRYSVIQNDEALDFADLVAGKGGLHFESAGCLSGGKKVFVNMLLPKTHFVHGDKMDKLEQRVLLATSHDGTLPLIMKAVSIRVYCQNSLSAALRETGSEIRIRHTPKFEMRVEAAQKALGLAIAYFDDLSGLIDLLAQEKFTTDKMAKLASAVVGIGKNEELSARKENARDAIVSLFTRGDGNAGETRWHALNAVTQWVDHERAGRGDGDDEGNTKAANRFEGALFGDGSRKKQTAFDMLTADLIKD